MSYICLIEVANSMALTHHTSQSEMGDAVMYAFYLHWSQATIPLTEEEKEQISGLNRNLVVCDMRKFWGYPFHTAATIV